MLNPEDTIRAALKAYGQDEKVLHEHNQAVYASAALNYQDGEVRKVQEATWREAVDTLDFLMTNGSKRPVEALEAWNPYTERTDDE